MLLTTLLLTGGSGSFGRAFIRTLLARSLVDRIISVSRNAEMRYRLEREFPDVRLIVAPGDVRQLDDLEAAYDGRVDVIVHAAAEKHIGTGQRHSQYVQSINVGGAHNIIRYARIHRVDRVLALSTDKACHPVPGQTYGQSKAEAERAFVESNQGDGVRFSLARYGNICGSSGSVIPLFIKQRPFGRLTVTDLRMSRYWMQLSDDSEIRVLQEPGRRATVSAVGLVLFALDHMVGSEIFVPRLSSASVAQVARAIGPECQIDEIGIRDGEKIHEQLIDGSEASRTWDLGNGVYVIMPTVEAVPSYPGAVRVPAGFSYSSNDDPLPVQYVEAIQ